MKLNKKHVNDLQAIAAAGKSDKAALRMAEKKWEAIVFSVLSGDGSHGMSASNCSLCQRFNLLDEWGCVINSCSRCPLYNLNKTACGDEESPFNEYWMHGTPSNALRLLNDIRSCSGKKKLKLAEFKAQM